MPQKVNSSRLVDYCSFDTALWPFSNGAPDFWHEVGYAYAKDLNPLSRRSNLSNLVRFALRELA